MNIGKHVVIPLEEYNRLKESNYLANDVIVNPKKKEFIKSGNEMRNVWNRDDLPPDEKIKHFTKELNNFKRRYDELTKPKPMEMILKNNERSTEYDDDIDLVKKNVLQSISKSNKGNAELLIDYLKTKPNIIKWNDHGEMIFRNEVIPGSNMTDMIIDSYKLKEKHDT